MDKRVIGGMIWIGLIVFSGCLNTTHDDVSSFHNNLKQRLGMAKWNANDKEIKEGVDSLLAKDLNATTAVQLALVNNLQIRPVFEEMGLSEKALIGAGVFEPLFDAKKFLEVLFTTLPVNVDLQELEQATARAKKGVYDLTADIEVAFYQCQSSLAQHELQKSLLDAAEEAFGLARRQREAGGINTLFVEDKKKELEQVKKEMGRTETELAAHKQKLAALLGLAESSSWQITQWLEEIPSFEPDLEEWQQLGKNESIDTAALKEAQARLLSARALTQQHAGMLLPLRLKNQLAAKKQQTMLTRNVYEMFQNERAEVQARIYYEMALRDYWIARAELKRAAHGLPQSKAQEE